MAWLIVVLLIGTQPGDVRFATPTVEYPSLFDCVRQGEAIKRDWVGYRVRYDCMAAPQAAP